MKLVLSDPRKDRPEGSLCTILPTSINASESLSWKPLLAVMGNGSIMNTVWIRNERCVFGFRICTRRYDETNDINQSASR